MPFHNAPTGRKVPMQVLALGFSRTGTAYCTRDVGICAHQSRVLVAMASPEELDMWIAAIRAKFYGEGTAYGRAEWDRLLGDCMELIAAYPDAKVVLTKRSPDSWWKSYEATVLEARKRTLKLRLSNWMDPGHNGKMEYLFRLVSTAQFQEERPENITEDIAKARFVARYDEIRRLTPKDRLLEFEVKDGWPPLAAFLGKEVPTAAFPRVNDTVQFNQVISAERRAILWAWAANLVVPLLAVGAAAMLGYFGGVRRL
ncbi:hypothetical protein B0H17DRAFT_1136796 [Mycena rosella]|uniref:Uncharacterized protein n=1 Tax=Mycena rosella TaxID=1033263 RepID=A0AAD7GE46_MYCRO|nr:hypothetical protein B0H17DRAFT_1136796 [Mycena rosella]